MQDSSVSKALQMLLATLILFAVTATVRGFALAVLWKWFVVPTFQAPMLSIPVAYGLVLIVGLLTRLRIGIDESSEDKSVYEQVMETLKMVLIKPALSLAFGWIVHLFM